MLSHPARKAGDGFLAQGDRREPWVMVSFSSPLSQPLKRAAEKRSAPTYEQASQGKNPALGRHLSIDPNFNRTSPSPVVCCQLSVLDFDLRFFLRRPFQELGSRVVFSPRYPSFQGSLNLFPGPIVKGIPLVARYEKKRREILCMANRRPWHPGFIPDTGEPQLDRLRSGSWNRLTPLRCHLQESPLGSRVG